MSDVLILPDKIICADEKRNIYKGYGVIVAGGIIKEIKKFTGEEIEKFEGEVVRFNNHVLVPGFVQTHIHLCQTLFRGLADDLELLDWLQFRTFPFENAHNEKSLRISVQLGINELLKSGTTTLLDMGTLRHQEVIFEELEYTGMRAFAGKCMMDENSLYPEFRADTKHELKYTYELAKKYHNITDLIKYGFAPRFVLSCSEELLKETAEMMKDFPGSIYHTHSSENKNECAEVRRRHNMDNLEYFDSLGVLNDHTVLAHCVHLKDNEVSLLKERDARVSHCPSSNLKLGSGFANIPLLLSKGINVSIGADGAPCNNSLNIFNEMKLASLIQKPLHGPTAMPAETVFRMATIEGAKALHIDNITGSIETGKRADLVLMNLEDSILPATDENLYSKIVYTAAAKHVDSVMVNGKWVVRNGNSAYDEQFLLNESKHQLQLLRERVK